MAEAVWSERDTTPGAIDAALRDLLTRHHAESEGRFAPARVLNLVVVVDADYRGEIENRLERISRYHPSRTILCAVGGRREAIDAWASLSFDDAVPEPGHLAVLRERVEIELGERHLRALDTVVGPLVVRDLATLVWAPHGHDAAVEALRRVAQVVLVDSVDEPEAGVALRRAWDWTTDLYVVDLAWLRSTPWRERVAAAFDAPASRRRLAEIAAVTVRHRHDSLATGVLFCGWLASRLGWRPDRLAPAGSATAGYARARRGEVAIRLEPVEQPGAPGLSGVTVELASGEAVSLDRAPGGLSERRRARDGGERELTVLGASRGEAGILGEGVRQALLRDRTYRPALEAARAMVGA